VLTLAISVARMYATLYVPSLAAAGAVIDAQEEAEGAA
jgi:hypothetical protein